MAMKRCEYCGEWFHAKRRDARFCTPRCRFDQWDAEHPRVLRDGQGRAYNGSSRRPSRDGSGFRIYVTDDLTDSEVLERVHAKRAQR